MGRATGTCTSLSFLTVTLLVAHLLVPSSHSLLHHHSLMPIPSFVGRTLSSTPSLLRCSGSLASPKHVLRRRRAHWTPVHAHIPTQVHPFQPSLRAFATSRLAMSLTPSSKMSSLDVQPPAPFSTSSSSMSLSSFASSTTAKSIPSGSQEEPSSSSTSLHSAYEHWVRRLYMTNLFQPVKMGLDNIERLHGLLGHPMDKPGLVVVHVAGTNGKGSVALKMAKTFEAHGLRTGLFISPHVASFRERMQVNSTLISEEQVVQLLPNIYKMCADHDIPATFFEITTALAFSFYDQQQCQVVVLETGLGGRLDATNVVAQPAISIITSIGLEHTRILGDTIEKIAKEKAGIMKEGRPVLVGPNVPHPVLRQCAIDKRAGPYYTVDDVLGKDERQNDQEWDYDVENTRIATAALQLVQQSFPDTIGTIPIDTIKTCTAIRPPCRFEVIAVPESSGTAPVSSASSPLTVILDVAHNPPAMKYMVQKLLRTYPNRRTRIVVGMSSDKDLGQCGEFLLDAVQNDATRIHLVEAAHPRAAKLEAILQATNLGGAHYDLERRSVTDQMSDAMRLARSNDEILVVCGSVFLMAEAREALGIDEPRDSAYIAEVAGSGFRHSQENFGNSTAMNAPLAV